MLMGKKVRILPTKKQEALMWQSVGVSRWSYNYYLNRRNEEYAKHTADFYAKYGVEYSKNMAKKLKVPVFKYSSYDCDKEIVVLKQTPKYDWLNDVDSHMIKQSTKQAETAFNNFFSGRAGFPKHKSRNKSDASFYSRYDKMHKLKIKRGKDECVPNKVMLAKFGVVELVEDIPDCVKYINPYISNDGVHWWLSFSYEVDETDKPQLTNTKLGIDLGIKKLAVCSDNSKHDNINKTKRIKQLEKRYKIQQRRLAKKVKGSKNRDKQKKLLRKTQIKLNNIRNNWLHQVTTEIINKLPKTVVMEDLNVKGMMKNRHLAKAIANQGWYTFRKYITYKAERKGIEVIIADRFFPSSKLCSNCGEKKKQLSLSDRTYICNCCGLQLDRDLNAAINLSNYTPKISNLT